MDEVSTIETGNVPKTKTMKTSKSGSILRQMKKQRYLLLMLLPGLAYYIIFKYIPIYGIIIAFKKYDFRYGILGSEWVGIKYFAQFIRGPFFIRLVKNTFLLSLNQLFWGFPVPIVFALLLNELKQKRFKKFVQTVSYIPHFISVVIIVGLFKQFLSPTSGIVNTVIKVLGGTPINFFMESEWFRVLFVGSGIWQTFGWSSIIYLAVMTNIPPSLYEAASIDGAGRFKKMWHITLPSMRPTIMILLILRLGRLLTIGFEKVLLMQNPSTYEVSDVISTYVYRAGIQQAQYSFASAVGLMNSLVAVVLILSANKISKKFTETGLW